MEFVINFDFFQDLDTIEKSRKTQIRKNEYFSLFLPLLLAIVFSGVLLFVNIWKISANQCQN